MTDSRLDVQQELAQAGGQCCRSRRFAGIRRRLIRESRRCIVTLLAAALAAGCATHSFEPSPLEGAGFLGRSISQSADGVTVTVAVPTDEEFRRLTGIGPYEDGIQPVWLRVENTRGEPLRLSYSSIDPAYFSALEVAWKYHGDFRGDAETALEKWFFENKLPRGVAAGSRSSGFVYTHAVTGTKDFNLDVLWQAGSANFTFFVPMPGFTPDYMQVDLASLYGPTDRLQTDNRAGLRALIEEFPAYSTDATGTKAGDPLNVVFVGTGTGLLRSLLRGGWQEQEAGSAETRLARMHFYRDRPPDGVFHKVRPDGAEKKELRLWLTPVVANGEPVWIGQVSYELSGKSFWEDPANYHIDPDVDQARLFLLEDFWYSQSLSTVAMGAGIPPSSAENRRRNFLGQEFFTDGRRDVLFVSEQPVGMDETQILIWETLFVR
jgi:LssY C-terminus